MKNSRRASALNQVEEPPEAGNFHRGPEAGNFHRGNPNGFWQKKELR